MTELQQSINQTQNQVKGNDELLGNKVLEVVIEWKDLLRWPDF